MMKNVIRILLFFSALLFFSQCNQPKNLYEQLNRLPNVVSVDSIFTDSTFNQQFEIYFQQDIDHNHPEFGTLNQRVILSHVDTTRPMVAVLEGYQIWDAKATELTKMFRANQVNIEHRFFNKSRPDSIPWDKLTIWQAATDQHIIINELQTIYKNSWLTTGISKGGQATMFHKRFYPNDVQAGVAYVAPLNYEREDPRINYFLQEVGSDEERQKIYNFQVLCFEHFDSLLGVLKSESEKNNWTFEFGYKKALEYTILEYSFAYWQWGKVSMDEIPGKGATKRELFDHLNHVANFTFFEDKSVAEYRPFFWAALTQIGIYSYDVKPFKKYLGDTTNYTFDFTAPKGTHPVYDYDAMYDVKQFLDTAGHHMMYIVGGLDPWGATAYTPTRYADGVRIMLKVGHHDTRIKQMEKKYRNYLYKNLERWMGSEVVDIYDEPEK